MTLYEQTTQTNPENSINSSGPSKKRRYVITGLTLLLIAAVGLYVFVFKNKGPNSNVEVPKLTKAEIDRGLTEDEEKIYKDRLTKAETSLQELNNRRGIIDSKEYFNAYMDIGFVHYGLGDLEKAVENYLKAVEQQPENYNGYTALHLAYWESENFDLARQAIEKASQINPSSSDVWRKRLEIEQNKFYVDFTRQTELYTEALEKTGRSREILVLYSRFLKQQNKLQEAVDILEEAQKISANSQTEAEIKELNDLIKQK
jgi:Tfp pilus assembly protein PilF